MTDALRNAPLTNAERQRRYREKLKAQARSGGDVVRAATLEMLKDEIQSWIDEELRSDDEDLVWMNGLAEDGEFLGKLESRLRHTITDAVETMWADRKKALAKASKSKRRVT